MTYETIIVETKGKVGIIRLNRPQALNALNAKVNEELTAAIDAFEADDDIGCVVITGYGEGVRGRRRHQGDGGQDPTWTPSRATSPPTGIASRACASR